MDKEAKGKGPRRRKLVNKLNELSNKEWLQFQKSWFVHNPPRRKQGVLRHPAKFPETLVLEFIEFFTKRGETVLDPMAGTGSTLAAALRAGRHSYGVELNPHYAAIAKVVVAEEMASIGLAAQDLKAEVIEGDARRIPEMGLPPIDYMITSPPYWDMLRMRGAETQKKRRESGELDTSYSDDGRDVGNIADYSQFVNTLVEIYAGLQPALKPNAYLTVIVKNVKKGGKVFPLAWDLGRALGAIYTLKDERIWCQDNTRLAPYGMGSAWVSNTVHHYCLQFRNED